MTDDVLIRRATAADAEALAGLSSQLGYPATPEAIVARLAVSAGQSHRSVFVACLPGGAVAGYIDLGVIQHLQSDAHVDIQGLVIDSAARNRGIGVRLLEQAEAWAKTHNVATIRVRSNVIRTDAHRFYEREGYIREKTSAVFRKSVGGGSGVERS